jgi:hypothetical protein
VISSATKFLVLVVLPNEESESMCIESRILPRGKNDENIETQLQVGSLYWLKCKTGGCCRSNTRNCPVHCKNHKLIHINKRTKNRVVLISYVNNDWGALIPPGEVDSVNTSIVVKFEGKIYRSKECDGDGWCLFYSLSNFIQNNKEIFKNVPIFNDRDSFSSSGVIDMILDLIVTLSPEDMKEIIERYPLDDIEENAQVWENKISNMSDEHSEWVTKFMTAITNALYTETQRYPFEVHALFMCWIFKIRIQSFKIIGKTAIPVCLIPIVIISGRHL